MESSSYTLTIRPSGTLINLATVRIVEVLSLAVVAMSNTTTKSIDSRLPTVINQLDRYSTEYYSCGLFRYHSADSETKSLDSRSRDMVRSFRSPSQLTSATDSSFGARIRLMIAAFISELYRI